MHFSKSNSATRRTFIRTSAAAAASVISSKSFAKIDKSSDGLAGKLTDRAKILMERFNLKYPIFQAAPGGEELAAALSQVGCMGALSLGWSSKEECNRVVTKFVSAKVNFYANFVLHFPIDNLDIALRAGVNVVQFSWGIPSDDVVKKIRNANARLGIQVASKAGALEALIHNPDFIICQGSEAGGHVQANDPIDYALQEVLSVAGQTPVLASGGIATGRDIKHMLKLGASGVVMGTRLIATREGNIHQVYKDSLVEAKEHSTVFTNCFDKGWNAMHRVLKNTTFSMWEAAGCPLAGNRPGENDILGQRPDGSDVPRYSLAPPGRKTTGNLKEMAMYAGKGVKDINDLPPVAELVPRLWNEFEQGG